MKRKNPKKMPHKLELKKYDAKARKHAVFVESKINDDDDDDDDDDGFEREHHQSIYNRESVVAVVAAILLEPGR